MCASLSRVRLFATPWFIWLIELSRPEYERVAFPFFRGPPQPRSPTLQLDSLPAEPQGKPKNSGVVAYPFSRGSSRPRNRTGVSCIAGGFFISWALREAHITAKYVFSFLLFRRL